MIKNKIKIMLQYRNKIQQDLLNVWNMSSKFSLNNKIAKERISLEELILMCDNLKYDIEIKDRHTGKVVVVFDESDLIKSENIEEKEG
jgi:hypothetical protein